MKHPVLHIRKGLEVYDDSKLDDPLLAAARDAELEREEGRKKRRPRPRRSRLTFLPLLVIAFALGALFIAVRRAPLDRATVAGWQAILRATAQEDTLILSVTFIQTKSPAAPSAPEASVRIELADAGQVLTLSGALVKSPMTLRGTVPYDGTAHVVQADVTVGGEHVRLSLAPRAVSQESP